MLKNKPSSSGWHVYQVTRNSPTFGEESWRFAVQATNALEALKRLQADDPIWTFPTVQYAGWSARKPSLLKDSATYIDHLVRR